MLDTILFISQKNKKNKKQYQLLGIKLNNYLELI